MKKIETHSADCADMRCGRCVGCTTGDGECIAPCSERHIPDPPMHPLQAEDRCVDCGAKTYEKHAQDCRWNRLPADGGF